MPTQQLAERTGGRSFAAVSQQSLESIYDDLGSTIGFVKDGAPAGLRIGSLEGGGSQQGAMPHHLELQLV